MTLSEPRPMPYMLEGVTYYGDTGREPEQIEPTAIASYVHCQSGIEPMQFVAWLCNELVTLDAIDPDCSK